MKKFLMTFIALVLMSSMIIGSYAHQNDVSVSSKKVLGKSVNIVVVNANSKEMKFDLIIANDSKNAQGWQDFSQMMKNKKPIVAINGNFFSAYEKDEKNIFPWGYLIKDGKEISSGAAYNKGAFAVLKDGSIVIDNENNIDISNVKTMVHAGPLLLKDDKIVYDPKNSGFSEDKINVSVAQRSAIGIDKNAKVMMITTVSTTYDLAKIMKELGCISATNLDGGASSALYAKGKIITNPGRKLNNVLCVYDVKVKK